MFYSKHFIRILLLSVLTLIFLPTPAPIVPNHTVLAILSCRGIVSAVSELIYRARHHLGTVSDENFRRRYGKKAADDAHRKLKKLNPHFLTLMADPGIVFWIDEFSSWVRKNKMERLSPKEARGRFSEHLGTKTVFRAMALTPAEAERILRDGMNPDRGQAFSENLQEQFAEGLRSRDGEPMRSTELIRVSRHQDIAIVASRQFLVSPNQDLYVFELKIPVLDTIHLRKSGSFLNIQNIPELASYRTAQINILYGELISVYPYLGYTDHPGEVESAITSKIDRSQIVGIKRLSKDEIPTTGIKWFRR